MTVGPVPQLSPTTSAHHLEVGDRVVHPHQGAGEVVAHHRRLSCGAPRDYVEIEIAYASMRIFVPCDGAARIGLRPIAAPWRVQRIVDVLESTPEVISENWAARQKICQAKLKGGDVLELAAVIRDLAGRAVARELPAGERSLLRRSRQLLASELRFALGVTVEEADAYIDEHLNTSRPASHAPAAATSREPHATTASGR